MLSYKAKIRAVILQLIGSTNTLPYLLIIKSVYNQLPVNQSVNLVQNAII